MTTPTQLTTGISRHYNARAADIENATRRAAKEARDAAAESRLVSNLTHEAAYFAEEAAARCAAHNGRVGVLGAQAQQARMAGRTAADLLPLYRQLIEEAHQAAERAVIARRAAAAAVAYLESIAQQEETN